MASPKVVVVTGANSGVGYEAVKAFLLSENPYHIFVCARTSQKANGTIQELTEESPHAKNTLEAVQLDLVSDESIEKAFEQVNTSKGRVDVLINNAGATFDIAFIKGQVSLRECMNRSYDVNVAGTHVFTWTFVPLLLKSSDPRLIFVGGLSAINAASEKYFPTPDLPAGWPKKISTEGIPETIGYRCSKLALNMLMLDWNHRLKADGVKVWSVAPGFLATNLGGIKEQALAVGGRHPREGGDILRRVAEGERDADTGKFVMKDGGILRW